ncbi:MAG: hypothetical protein JWP59_3193 [Massilia sp.]|nr:hypothetical protein [Massilia sp.]
MDWAFEQSPDCIKLMAPNGNLLAMNRNGQSALEIDDINLIYGASWDSLWPAASRGVVLAAIATALTGTPARFDALCPTLKGTPKWWDVVVTPIHGPDGAVERLLAVSRDISAVRRAVDKELETAARLQFTLAATGLGEWDLDLDTGAWQHNRRHDQCFGHHDGAPAWSLAILLDHVHLDDRARVQALFDDAIARCAPIHFDARVRWGDGSLHWINMQGSCYRSAHRPDLRDGQCTRLLGIVADITERMLLTETLHDAGRKKDEFLAMLAHELRNPLAPISAAAQLLSLGGADERMTQKASAVIDRQARHMNHLLDDLLDTARVTQGLVTLEMRRVDLKRVIAEALEQVRPAFEKMRHQLDVQLATCATVVDGDGKRLVQVLVNLLDNAAKYTPGGGAIAVRLDCSGGHADITVSDNGIGMDEATLGSAFTLFSQAVRSSDRSAGGLGLGLALVKAMVERHGGQVSARSDGKGCGSRFVVRLPLRDGAGMVTEAAKGAAQDAAQQAPARPLRVLIVDDNVDAAEMLGMVLEGAGHQVALAFNGAGAIAQAASAVPDVFLLDVGLPDMSGHALAVRLRAMAGGARATIIAITGYGSPADRAASSAAGIDHHLTKPVDPAALARLLEQVRPPR